MTYLCYYLHIDTTIGRISSGQVVGNIGHGLEPASHHHTVLSQLQRLRGHHYAFHAAGTNLNYYFKSISKVVSSFVCSD